MPVIVQKFGGTSVNTLEKRDKVLAKVIAAKDQGFDVVVVVSAMGRKGEPYATDTFLDMLQEIGPNPSPKTKDLLTSCGEIITTCMVAHALEQKGYKACPMTGFQAGIMTDRNFTNGEVVNIEPNKIRKALDEGNVVVVAGFQGWTEEKDITTLGRGGSDTTAIALGGALGADMVEIYTDVPGIAFTDPRLLAEAPFIEKIDFYPMYILARAGAKVIHPRAVKAAITYDRPFTVRSTFSDGEGTLIGKPGQSVGGLYGAAVLKDVHLVTLKGQDDQGFWRQRSVDELFYQKDDEGVFLAVQVIPETETDKQSTYTATDACDLVTFMWDEDMDISPAKIKNILEENGVLIKGYFKIESGGAWAVPAKGAALAIQAVFNNFTQKAAQVS